MDKNINLLNGNVPAAPETAVARRITQTDILPRAVKSRHLDTNLFAVRFIQESGLPTTPENDKVFFAVDTGKLYIWNGTKFVSATLA